MNPSGKWRQEGNRKWKAQVERLNEVSMTLRFNGNVFNTEINPPTSAEGIVSGVGAGSFGRRSRTAARDAHAAAGDVGRSRQAFLFLRAGRPGAFGSAQDRTGSRIPTATKRHRAELGGDDEPPRRRSPPRRAKARPRAHTQAITWATRHSPAAAPGFPQDGLQDFNCPYFHCQQPPVSPQTRAAEPPPRRYPASRPGPATPAGGSERRGVPAGDRPPLPLPPPSSPAGPPRAPNGRNRHLARWRARPASRPPARPPRASNAGRHAGVVMYQNGAHAPTAR